MQELTKSNSCSGGSKLGAIGTKLLHKNDTVTKKAKLRDGEREKDKQNEKTEEFVSVKE